MKVDVILSVYKGKRWVGEAIASVLAQTYENWHLTVVDDASPDDTYDYVQQLCANDGDRITVVRLSQNMRAAGARMNAIRQTSGEVIAFLDQDDRWRPEKLQRQIERFRGAPLVHAVHTDAVHIDAEGSLLAGTADKENAIRAAILYDRLPTEEVVKKLFAKNSIRLTSAVVLRNAFESVGGFNTDLFGGEDWEFWVRFAAAYRIGHLAQPLLERRVHATNTSVVYGMQRSHGLMTALDMVVATYPYLASLAGKRRAWLLPRAILANLNEKAYKDALKYAWKLIQLRPFDAKALALLGLCCLGPYSKYFLHVSQ